MPPRAIIILVTIIAALAVAIAAWAARSGRMSGRASKMVMVAAIAAAGVIVMLYPFLGFSDPVGG